MSSHDHIIVAIPEVHLTIYYQAVKSSTDLQNSAFFHGFLVTTEISVNLPRNLSCHMGGGGISVSTLPIETVNLSKFAEFHEESNVILFRI